MKIFVNNIFSRAIPGRTGMTLPELLVAAALLILAFTGIILAFLQAMELQEVAQATSVATKASMSRIEQMRATPHSQIKPTFHMQAFDVAELNGKGVSYVNDSDPKLLLVTVTVAWKQRTGRIYGEDKNLNGQIDAGEDVVNIGILDSPVQLVTKIFEK